MIAEETQISALVTDWSKIGPEQTAPGITRQMVVGQNVMMVRFTFEPFLVTPQHTHPHEQMTLVVKGRVRFFISGVEHINKIDDEIVSQIRKSKFLVADFTGHRGGVYFEAGFAMGLGLPVFWTCLKDDLANLHFDIRQYNCIDWIDTADLAKRLKRRIEAIIGIGPIKPA